MASLPAASPVEESQKEMLKLIPNLMGYQLRRTKKIPSVAVILAIGETITGSYPVSLPPRYARICSYQEERVRRQN